VQSLSLKSSVSAASEEISRILCRPECSLLSFRTIYILSCLRFDLPSGLFSTAFIPHITVSIPVFPHTRHMPHPSPYFPFYDSNNTCYLLTYLLTLRTHLLTPCSTVLLEKLTAFQLVKKFPTFYGTRKFITAFTSARQLSLS